MAISLIDIDTQTISVTGCRSDDYPKFVDAYIEYAEWMGGKPLNEDELEELGRTYPGLITDECTEQLAERAGIDLDLINGL